MRCSGGAVRDTTVDAGFSLVESLASLLVVAMIGLMLTTGVTTGRRVWDRVDTRAASGEALESAQEILRDRLEQVFPEGRFDSSAPYSDFTGAGEGLTFLANPGEAGRPSALRRYTLGLTTAGKLNLSSISDVGDPDTAPVSSQILLAGVRRLDIAYFGPVGANGRRGWLRDWNQRPSPPEIVRIRLAFFPGDQRRWPDLLIHPRATIDTTCQISTLTHRCKGRA